MNMNIFHHPLFQVECNLGVHELDYIQKKLIWKGNAPNTCQVVVQPMGLD